MRRVEVGPGSDTGAQAAALARLGARLTGAGHTGWGAWTIAGGGQLRAIAAPGVAGESLAALALQARWRSASRTAPRGCSRASMATTSSRSAMGSARARSRPGPASWAWSRATASGA